MMLNHVHFQVRDLKAAIAWFQSILQLKPGFHDERIATFLFGAFTVILDAASVDAPATLGSESDDCDRDFRGVIDRGAVSIDPPADKEYGVRAAYFKGPGRLSPELLRHSAELKQHPSEWMSWNYRDTLARLAQPAAAQYDESFPAEKDRLRSWSGDILECPENRLL